MVTTTMSTRTMTRKRRWPSSPDKTRARTELNFGHLETTPPRTPKRRKIFSYTDDEQSPVDYDSDSEQSFSTKSFYGKREKKCFPHSPHRRKAVREVLSKLTNENLTPDSENSLSKCGAKSTSNRLSKDSIVVLREGPVENNMTSDSARKISQKSPGSVCRKSSKPSSPASCDLEQKTIATLTAVQSEKKFFKHKSPASASKAVGRSIVIGKGFNLKFMPRRQSTGSQLSKQKKKRKLMYTGRKKNVDHVKINNTTDCIQQSRKPSITAKEVDCNENVTAANDASEKNTFSSSTDTVKNSGSLSCEKANEFPGSADLFESSSEYSGRSTTVSQSCSDNISVGNTSSVSGPSNRMTRAAEKKLFPIFSPQCSPEIQSNMVRLTRMSKSSANSKCRRPLSQNKDTKEQMILDAGQKHFGATQCDVCGMVYTHAEPTDEATHTRFHQDVITALKFTGWRKERVVQEFPNDGSRVVMVLPEDLKYAVKKVEEINKIMGHELGFPEASQAFRIGYKAFLYISEDKQCEACCIAESITEGYRVIPDISQPSQQAGTSQQAGRRPWCCRSEPEPATVGVSRIWVHNQQRRKGIASKLLDCVRQWFEYGVVIKKKRMAFSDPTPDGKLLATGYTGTSEFLVYKYT